ncbi:MAG: hypothetical protein E7562_05635 [Ruminococcaceae bacterium]|nr:hypothetical protein [Oscillospiraceae bacterium]
MNRKVIGIDFGHCDVSLACPVVADIQNMRYEVRRLVAQNTKDQIISSQLILTNDQMAILKGNNRPGYELLKSLGEIMIGNKLPAYVVDGEKFCYFKAPPKLFDTQYGNSDAAKENGITHGMLMACYVFALLENAFKYNVGDLSEAERNNVDLLIGCPTTQDWTSDEAKNEYASLIKNAVGVHDVIIIPESRAAMFSTIENGKGKVSALNGAAVFDFGSSTADFTYMLLGRKLMEFSWTLGASAIEREMTINAYRQATEMFGEFGFKATSFADIEDNLRSAKEEYYNGIFGPYGHDIICTFERDEDNKRLKTPITVDDEYMTDVTKKNAINITCDSKTPKSGSWQDLCREFFEEAKRIIESSTYLHYTGSDVSEERACTLETVVLTGGASKMGYISEICKEVFPDKQIIIEDNPSHTVSNGLAWIAVSDYNVERCCDNVVKKIEGLKSCSIETLQGKLSDIVFENVKKLVVEETTLWADASGDTLTVETLLQHIQTRVDNNEIGTITQKMCESEIKKWKNDLSQKIVKAVNEEVKNLYSEEVAREVAIPNDVWQSLQSGSINYKGIDVDKMISGIDLSSLPKKITAMVTKIVAYVIGVILIPETFGVSLLVAWFAANTIGSSLKDTDLKKPRSRRIRQSVKNSIENEMNKNKAEMMVPFVEDFKSQSNAYKEIITSTVDRAFEIVMLKRFDL